MLMLLLTIKWRRYFGCVARAGFQSGATKVQQCAAQRSFIYLCPVGRRETGGNEQVREMLHSVCRHAVKSAMRALKPCLTQSVSRCACPQGEKTNFKGRLILLTLFSLAEYFKAQQATVRDSMVRILHHASQPAV